MFKSKSVNLLAMKYSLSVATITFLMVLSAATGATLFSLSQSNSSDSSAFSIDSSSEYGINQYTLVEIDEGDNDEEDFITESFMSSLLNLTTPERWFLGTLETAQ
jgi:hypothetical protein